MGDKKTILAFENVSIALQPPYEAGLKNLSFELAEGEVGLFVMNGSLMLLPLADLAQGLIYTDEGKVQFCGHGWRRMDPANAAKARGTIGRVFESHGWLSNLDMDENVTLPLRHHTIRPESEIESEALALAKHFGFSELPHIRPARMSRSDLRRVEWIRALLGPPRLIILEYPLRDVSISHGDALIAAIQDVRRQGSAVLILTAEIPPPQREQLKPNVCFQWDESAGTFINTK